MEITQVAGDPRALHSARAATRRPSAPWVLRAQILSFRGYAHTPLHLGSAPQNRCMVKSISVSVYA